jgi:Flp pilus assembly protein TadD
MRNSFLDMVELSTRLMEINASAPTSSSAGAHEPRRRRHRPTPAAARPAMTIVMADARLRRCWAFPARAEETVAGIAGKPVKHVLTAFILCVALITSACAESRDNPVRLSSRDAPADLPLEDVTTSVSGNYLAGRHAAFSNDSATAARFFGAALAARPDDPVLRRRAFLTEVLAGRITSAVALGKALPSSDTASGTVRLVTAATEIRAGRFRSAERILQDKSGNLLDALLQPMTRAWAQVGEHDDDGAVDTLKTAQVEPALIPLLSFHTALVQDLAGNATAAEAAFREAATELGSSPRLVQAEGRFLERQGKTEQARTLYQQFLDQAEDHPVIAAELSRLESGSKPERLIETPAQGAAEAFYDVGSLLDTSLGGESLIYLRLALYLDPHLDIARVVVADLLEKSGREAEAIKQYDRVPPDSPLYTTAQIQKAMALDGKDKTDEAIAVLDALIKRAPRNEDAIVARADILRMRKRFAQAAAGYDRAIKLMGGKSNERQWGLYYARGVSLERAHRWPEAERDLLHALKLKPDQPLVLNYLGYSWIEQGKHQSRAQAMIEKAAALRPTDGYIIDSLGWVLYRLGHYPEAATQLERAVELRPEDPLINGHLGDAYWRVGRRLEARFQWRQALALNPPPETAVELKRKIESGLGPASAQPADPHGEHAELQPNTELDQP